MREEEGGGGGEGGGFREVHVYHASSIGAQVYGYAERERESRADGVQKCVMMIPVPFNTAPNTHNVFFSLTSPPPPDPLMVLAWAESVVLCISSSFFLVVLRTSAVPPQFGQLEVVGFSVRGPNVSCTQRNARTQAAKYARTNNRHNQKKTHAIRRNLSCTHDETEMEQCSR